MSIARGAVSLIGVALLGAQPLAAQFSPPPPRPATVAEVAFGNVLVGGITASTRALINKKDPLRAFALGAFGGAVHFAGKYVAVEPGSAYGILGGVVAGTGTSFVGNAGRGVPLLEELTIPFMSARVRVSPRAPRKLRASIDLTETVLIASALTTRDLEVNWDRTLTSGALVSNLRRGTLEFDDGSVGGITVGPVVLIDPASLDQPSTARHELVHVQQHRFASEAWGLPIEEFLRRHVPGLARVPAWLEIGGMSFVLRGVDNALFGADGMDAVIEAEAYRLMRR